MFRTQLASDQLVAHPHGMFKPFDPLEAKSILNTEVATNALKREIRNILDCYVGWFDPFCELIQNSLDAIEEQANVGGEDGYVPTIRIKIDIRNNSLTVTDNGTGLSEQKFKQFLAPDVSFKSGNTRGYKGVGATYLAYGFNYMQIATKCGDFCVVGKLADARKWLSDPSPAGNPEVRVDTEPIADSSFDAFRHGTSITVRFDNGTHPRDLGWFKAMNAKTWRTILSVRTGLGAFNRNPNIQAIVTVVDKEGAFTEESYKGIEYLWPHEIVPKALSYSDLLKKSEDLFRRDGAKFRMPASYTNLDMFYDIFDYATLEKMVKLDDTEREIGERYTPTLYFAYAYSATVWSTFNEGLGIRSTAKLLSGGIQMAANNMPQGDLIQIPLTKNVGIQNQVHVLIHFNNCSVDLGRKGFQSEIVEFAKHVSKDLIQGPLIKFRLSLRRISGAAPDLKRENAIEKWKEEMVRYEKEKPLAISSEAFFLPTKKVSITSAPTREQDVIALFNQFLAGGIIRGVRILSTNERFTYDSLFRVVIEEPVANQLYDRQSNPLGLSKSVLEAFDTLPFESGPKILEYKYSLDGLIEDIDTEEKNPKDIGLVVVWETGDRYKEHYQITSLLDTANLGLRQYHGVTHVMTNLTSGQREMDLIVLSELIDGLNQPETTEASQRVKYEG